jgi:hypothetical protein
MIKIRTAVRYYFTSLLTVLKRFSLRDVLKTAFMKKTVIKHHDRSFCVGGLMDIWAIKEVISDDCYKFGRKARGVVIDIGAGVGDFSIWASEVSERVYAVEVERGLNY